MDLWIYGGKSYEQPEKRRRSGSDAEIRPLPFWHGSAEHRRIHRMGPFDGPVHSDRLDAK